MTYRAWIVTFTLGVAACGPKHSSSNADDACAKAARNAYKAGEGRGEPGSREYTISVDAMADVCRTDHWSDAQIQCMTTVTDLKSDDTCEKLFTSEQKDHVEHAFEAGKRDRRAREEAEEAQSTPRDESTGTTAAPSGDDTKMTKADTEASLEMARGIIKLLTSMTKSFEDVKGDVLQKTTDGSTIYRAKNTSYMMADEEVIAIKPSGSAYYLASWKGNKHVAMSFSAFTAGMNIVTNQDGNFVIAPDEAASTGGAVVFTMKLKGVKVGTYTADPSKGEGTMILGLL